MGTEYCPIVGVGKFFDSEQDAVNWYAEKAGLSEEQLDDIEEYGLEECLEDLNASWQNHYTAEGYYLFIPIDSPVASVALADMREAIRDWFDRFGEEPSFIADVMVY